MAKAPKPVVETRINHLVGAIAALRVSQRDMADLAAPAFAKRHTNATAAARLRQPRMGAGATAASCV